MILDAVLLSLAKIASSDETKMGIAILPEMRIAVGDGIQVINPVSQYEIWLTGNVDYAVIQYANEKTTRVGIFVVRHRILLTSIKERLLGVDNSRDDAFKLARGRLFLVEAKRLREHDVSLASHTPEAVSPAITLVQITGCAGDYSIPMSLSTHLIFA
jgi:hypothetical protein